MELDDDFYLAAGFTRDRRRAAQSWITYPTDIEGSTPRTGRSRRHPQHRHSRLHRRRHRLQPVLPRRRSLPKTSTPSIPPPPHRTTSPSPSPSTAALHQRRHFQHRQHPSRQRHLPEPGGTTANSLAAARELRHLIAPLWGNISMNASGDDVFIDSDANHMTIRWVAYNAANSARPPISRSPSSATDASASTTAPATPAWSIRPSASPWATASTTILAPNNGTQCQLHQFRFHPLQHRPRLRRHGAASRISTATPT